MCVCVCVFEVVCGWVWVSASVEDTHDVIDHDQPTVIWHSKCISLRKQSFCTQHTSSSTDTINRHLGHTKIVHDITSGTQPIHEYHTLAYTCAHRQPMHADKYAHTHVMHVVIHACTLIAFTSCMSSHTQTHAHHKHVMHTYHAYASCHVFIIHAILDHTQMSKKQKHA
jgi:hypothetical protein